MANPLFQALGGNRQTPNDGGFSQMIQGLNQFRNSFHGNPTDKVQELLNSGKMTQQQYNQLSQMARQIASLMGR